MAENPKDFEQQHIAPEQAARYEADVWEDNIAEYLKTNTKITVAASFRDKRAWRSTSSA